MIAGTPAARLVEVGELLPGEGTLTVAADVFVPSRMRSLPVALFCLPGGALTRHYYHLRAEGDFSFAAYMASRGFIVVTLDPLGVGDSTRPRAGYRTDAAPAGAGQFIGPWKSCARISRAAA